MIPGIDLNFPDPFEAIEEGLREVVQFMLDFFSQVLGAPIRPEPTTWFNALFGQTIGLAFFLTIPVLVVIVSIVMLVRRRLRSLLHVFVVILAFSTLGLSWLAICNWLIGFGDTLAGLMSFFESYGTPGSFSLPDTDSIWSSIFSLMWIGLFGTILIGIIFIYVITNYVIMLLVPIAFALSPLGKRSQSLLEWLVSIGLVSMIFGRAVARFCIELGKVFIANLPGGDNWIGQTAYIVAAFVLAIVSQFVLVWAVHQGVQNVAGRIIGRTTSKVQGDVNATNRRPQPVDVKSVNNAHAATMNPVVTTAKPTLVGQARSQVIRTARTVAVEETLRIGATKVIVKYGSNAHPAAKAAVIVANHVAKQKRINTTQTPPTTAEGR